MLKSRKHQTDFATVYWHIGIIDYLGTYTALKKVERNLKLMKKEGDPSSANADLYAKRFATFIKSCFSYEKSLYNNNIDDNFF